MKAALALAALIAAALVGLPLVVLLVSVSASAGASDCDASTTAPTIGEASRPWVATAYGPPWGGIQGDGITATGLDLMSGPPAYEVAVDPSVIALGSYVYVQPNPFDTSSAFYAGDTGGAITGHHVDIYDWKGRASQDNWGTRNVTVTPAPAPVGQNLLAGVAPTPAESEAGSGEAADCQAAPQLGATALTPGQTAKIEADGSASVPSEAPVQVERAIAAGNLIHTLPYPEPDVHYGTLAKLWPAYDCSGATSFVLYEAGLLGANALDSSELESYGQPGPGRWITIYANSAHAWIVIAGIALDTADYGGPPIPAGSGPRWRSEALANLSDGTSYAARHPPGL